MKKILIPVSALFVAGFAHAQSLTSSENYVYSKTYLTDPTGSNVKTAETVQYFDGLGRPKQVVNVKASPGSKDVVTYFEYDNYGRQIKDYLPVPQNNTGNGALVPSPLSNATNTPYGAEKIYAEKALENSPLDRVLSQKQVGDAWNNKPVTFGYDANIDGEVKKYVATFDYTTFTSSIVLSSTGFGANQLYKNSVTDEDGNKTIEFKNGEGQVVLVRKMLDATTEADTYYVYNDYGQLTYVIPPLAVVANNVDEQTTLKNLCYQYKYDNRNRLVEKKLPGKGWEYMVYDKQDRLVGTKDSVNPWLVTKYDQFGRVAYTGTYTSGGSRSSVQAEIDGASNSANNEARASSPFNNSGMDVYYTNTAFPTSVTKVLSVNYYDTYPTGTPVAPTTQTVLSDDAQSNAVSTKSLPVASYIKNIEDDNWTKNYTWYDAKGRSVATYSINHLGGYTKTEMDLDFSGTVQQSITRHKRLNTDVERTITENFTYDHQNRLLGHVHQVDNLTPEFLAQNTYNELSQLTIKKVGGVSQSAPLQTVNYAYNIRGWMTKINDPQNLVTEDLFGYKINYNLREGLEIPNNDYSYLAVKPKFNGNIAEVIWKSNTNPNDNVRTYGYVYDGLNRLRAGFYQKDNDPSAKEYYEKIDYDLSGNITHLKRSTSLEGNTSAKVIDDLAFQYFNNNHSNRLQYVTDTSTDYRGYPDTSGVEIDYDDNGNMTSHEDKGIENLVYNHLNLPNHILFNYGLPTRGGVIRNNTSYLYRADGVKLRKIYNFAPPNPMGVETQLITEVTDYIDGFQYKGNGKVGKGSFTSLLFFPTAEGYYNFENNKYIYNYSDHLGNVRLSYFHNGNSVEVLEENNYYPFGLKHEGYNPTSGNPSYQYKYNGKELQTDSGMYDYGARFYMPDIGRWGVVDPLAEKMPSWSPYAYAFDNPVRFIDPDGMEPMDPDPRRLFKDLFKTFIGTTSQYFHITAQNNGLKRYDPNYYTRLGRIFENTVLGSLGENKNTKPYRPNMRSAQTVIPDIVGESLKTYFDGKTNKKTTYNFPEATFQDAKFTGSGMVSDQRDQIKGFIDVLSNMKGGYVNGVWNPSIKASDYGVANLVFITTVGTTIDSDIVIYASSKNVRIFQRTIQQDEDNPSSIRIAPFAIPYNLSVDKVNGARSAITLPPFNKAPGQSENVNWKQK